MERLHGQPLTTAWPHIPVAQRHRLAAELGETLAAQVPSARSGAIMMGMRDHDDDARSVPEPQGRLAGLPYDFRRPTASGIRARVWNPDDPRILTPKTFGWGLGVNLYWLLHPVRLARARRRSRGDGQGRTTA